MGNLITGATSLGSAVSPNGAAVGGGGAPPLAISLPTRTANDVLVVDALVPFDCTSGNLTATMPANPTPGMRVAAKKTDASANIVTITAPFNGNTTATTFPLRLQGLAKTWIYGSDGTWWTIQGDLDITTLLAYLITGKDIAPNTVSTLALTLNSGTAGSFTSFSWNNLKFTNSYYTFVGIKGDDASNNYQPAFAVSAAGSIGFHAGELVNTSADVRLVRSAANTLTLTDGGSGKANLSLGNLTASGAIMAPGSSALTLSNGAGAVVVNVQGNQVSLFNSVRFVRMTDTSAGIQDNAGNPAALSVSNLTASGTGTFNSVTTTTLTSTALRAGNIGGIPRVEADNFFTLGAGVQLSTYSGASQIRLGAPGTGIYDVMLDRTGPNAFRLWNGTTDGSLSLGSLTATGPLIQPGLAKTASYTILATDGDIEANATSAAFTLTYHALTGLAGLIRRVTNTGTANGVTVTLPSGTTFLNGSGQGTASMVVGVGNSATLKINAAANKVMVI